jgi:hypothetical protein
MSGRPEFDERGVPRCTRDKCPAFDGKRCDLMGYRPGPLCEPAVAVMAEDLRHARAALRHIARVCDEPGADVGQFAACASMDPPSAFAPSFDYAPVPPPPAPGECPICAPHEEHGTEECCAPCGDPSGEGCGCHGDDPPAPGGQEGEGRGICGLELRAALDLSLVASDDDVWAELRRLKSFDLDALPDDERIAWLRARYCLNCGIPHGDDPRPCYCAAW